MKRILVVDDQAIIRLLVAGALEDRGYEVVTASDGEQALQIARTQKPDLVLLDLTMPQLDGLTVLRTMRQSMQLREIPVIVLTDTNERSEIIEIASEGIHSYLLKSAFEPQEFLKRVDAVVGASSDRATKAIKADRDSSAKADVWMDCPGHDLVAKLELIKPILEHGEATKLLRETKAMRSLSPIAARVTLMVQKGDCSLADIARVIQSDHAISARVMQLANSSAFRLSEPVTTVERAVSSIGMRRIEGIVVNIAVINCFDEKSLADQINVLGFWEHAATCAAIASEVCAMLESKPEQSQSAMLAGLLHDVGRLVLIEALGPRYGSVIDVARHKGLPLDMVEMRMLRLDHARGIKPVLSDWMFPGALAVPITNHHRTAADIRRYAPEYLEQSLTCALANLLAHGLLSGDSGDQMLRPAWEYARELKLNPQALESLVRGIAGKVEDLKQALFCDRLGAAWPDMRGSVRRDLGEGMNALYISEVPAFDPHYYFFQQIALSPGTPPCIAAIQITKAGQLGQYAQQLDEREKIAGVSRLPLVIFSPTSQLAIPASLAEMRRIELLPPTVSVRDVVSTLNSLMSDPTIRRTAAA